MMKRVMLSLPASADESDGSKRDTPLQMCLWFDKLTMTHLLIS
jgi:hypothetical protein